MNYNLGESIVEQVLREPTSTLSTSQAATADTSALHIVTSTAKQEPAVVTVAPTSSVVTTAPSAAASASVAPLATLQAPVVFKQLQQPRTYNGSTSWKDYRAHFERVYKVNGWTTSQDKAQNLTLFLESVRKSKEIRNLSVDSRTVCQIMIWRNIFAYTLVTLQPQCSKPASLRMLQSQHDQRKA